MISAEEYLDVLIFYRFCSEIAKFVLTSLAKNMFVSILYISISFSFTTTPPKSLIKSLYAKTSNCHAKICSLGTRFSSMVSVILLLVEKFANI